MGLPGKNTEWIATSPGFFLTQGWNMGNLALADMLFNTEPQGKPQNQLPE